MGEITDRQLGKRNIALGIVVLIPSLFLLQSVGGQGPAKFTALILIVFSFGLYKFLRGAIGCISNEGKETKRG